MLRMAKDNKGGEGKNEKQWYREGGPEQRVHETQCSCGENSLSISPFPGVAGISHRKPFSRLQPCHRQPDLCWHMARLYHSKGWPLWSAWATKRPPPQSCGSVQTGATTAVWSFLGHGSAHGAGLLCWLASSSVLTELIHKSCLPAKMRKIWSFHLHQY